MSTGEWAPTVCFTAPRHVVRSASFIVTFWREQVPTNYHDDSFSCDEDLPYTTKNQ